MRLSRRVSESEVQISILGISMLRRLIHALALLQVEGLGQRTIARVVGLFAPSVIQELQVVGALSPLLAQFVSTWSYLLSGLCLHRLEALQTRPIRLIFVLFSRSVFLLHAHSRCIQRVRARSQSLWGYEQR